MEKLRIEDFEVHKKKILGIISEFEKAEDEVPEEKQKQMLTEYEDTIRTILSYDLSDIPASMWEGMYITNTDNLEINFEGTGANLDFSVLPEFDLPRRRWFGDAPKLPSFKGCKITNYPFESRMYRPEMFDEEFVIQNPDRFLSQDVPEELQTRF